MQIDIYRHAQSEMNSNRILQGHLDSPLSALGRQQAIDARQQNTIDYLAVYSSDLKRAYQTAKLLTTKPVIKSDKLREFNFGVLQGINLDDRTVEEEKLMNKIKYERDYVLENGESANIFGQRVVAEFHRIVSLHKDDDLIAIITHGGVMRALLNNYLKLTDRIRFDNCERIRINFTNQKFTLI